MNDVRTPSNLVYSSNDSPNTSCNDNSYCLTRLSSSGKKKTRWYDVENVPIAIINVSILQIFFHIFYSTRKINKILRFDPNRRYEIWRFVTYMLVHDDWSHVALNVVIQCIFAGLLERRQILQGHLKVLTLYVLGGITGVLGAACLHPDLVIGASAGGYSLLMSNLADVILNYDTIKYKYHQTISIAVLVVFDVIYDIVHMCSKKEPQVSWQAHFVGGLTGLFLGLVLFKCHGVVPLKLHRNLFWTGIFLYCVLVISFIIVTIQIGKCTPTDVIKFQYIYVC